MPPAAPEPLRVERASPADRAEALTLALSRVAPAERQRHVADWDAAVAKSEAALWVGYRGTKLAAATLVQMQPGRTATVRPPCLVDGQPRETAGQLLAGVVDDLARRRVQVAQALLETDTGPDADAFCENGFRHASDLLYLVSLRGAFPTSAPADGLEFVPYREAWRDRLAHVVEQTYQGSLDCPQLDSVRSVDDVLAGYRAIGQFDPARWLIVQLHAADVGCLLLADHPGSDAWELVYLGLVAAERGRGFGVAMARFAQWLTGQAGRERLLTAVDADNGPAIAAYAAAGFVGWDRRSVFLRAL